MTAGTGRPRVVLVIGASSGIGRVTARLLAENGDRVAVASRDAATLAAVASGLDGEVLAVAVDILDADAVTAAVDRVVAEFGHLDAVVHTAQVMTYGRIEDVPRATYERTLETSTHGTANIARVVLPLFRRQGHGTLVVVNSLLGEIAVPAMGVYVAAKWAQLGLARTLQLEVRDAPDVDVCIVSPGAIDTPIYDQAANYAGRGGFPPPPVLAPERCAKAIIRCLDRPRRHVEVGPANPLIVLGFRLLPWLYDRIVGPLARLVVFRGPESDGNDGNVHGPVGTLDAERAGWSLVGRRRR